VVRTMKVMIDNEKVMMMMMMMMMMMKMIVDSVFSSAIIIRGILSTHTKMGKTDIYTYKCVRSHACDNLEGIVVDHLERNNSFDLIKKTTSFTTIDY